MVQFSVSDSSVNRTARIASVSFLLFAGVAFIFLAALSADAGIKG